MSIMVEAWGDYALFTRPEMKTERVSYDCITPSAARGLIESIYYHPSLRWHIDRIYILNPICFTNLRRNEIDCKISAGNMMSDAKNGRTSYIVSSNHIQQRATMMLQNVHYVIEAHFTMTDKASPLDTPGKFQNIVKRRLRTGQCYSQPYFGCRECTAYVKQWEGGTIPTITETRDLGWMLYDMDYSNPSDIRPMFFRAQIVNGIIDLTGFEVKS